MQDFLNQTYFNNTILSYLIALGVFVLGIIIINIFKRIVLSRLKKWSAKTDTTIDDFLIKGIEKSGIPLLYFGSFYLAAKTLTIPDKTFQIIYVLSAVLITFFAIKFITSSINYSLNLYLDKQEKAEERKKQVKGITTLINLIIWALGFIFLLDNLGFEITAVIAGLGIGGIAIALAAQTILGDLFSYFVIFFDRPFEIGDFIIVGDKIGTVEYIGIKTTRLRSLSGEQIVLSNTDLTNSRVHNYKRMEKRRVVFKLGVVYQTPAKILNEIPALVRSIIESQSDVTFDRGHFSSYGDFSLNFEFVYFVLGSDYVKYMDTQQKINLSIYEEFEKKGIEFAYPTQTLFVNKTDSQT
jgi:small-conductance mechanosensitive channel